MASTLQSTTEQIEYRVVTTRGVISKIFSGKNALQDASEYQAQMPKWSILKVTVTIEDVTPLLLEIFA